MRYIDNSVVFAAAAGDKSSDEGPDPASVEEEASNGSPPLVRWQPLDEEMKDAEVVSTTRVIGMCLSRIYTLRIRVISLNMYYHAVLDTFADDPNTARPDDTGDYAALNSDGRFEGNSIFDDDDGVDWVAPDYPGIYGGDHVTTAGALNAASTSLGTFLRFDTPQLLEKIAKSSNDYFKQNLEARVEAQHAKQQVRQEKKPDFQAQSPQQIKSNLKKNLLQFRVEICTSLVDFLTRGTLFLRRRNSPITGRPRTREPFHVVALVSS
ncbi:unnamed protein product [Phytophthora fragariaefolia]|uniref:Unnamed protein product n=1 Tax=Phytophthora fragariaefolia TaxID=1490495 RepID=A0A9W6XKK5_9STRA|nr:unnamed protein product [Phytophthora fragariaefolia]